MENNEPKPETGSLADATAMLLGEPNTEENQVAEEVVEATDETADVAVEENVTEEDTTNTPEEVEVQQDIPDRYTVKVDGVEEEWTLDELKRSASGQSYIQKRMQEVANLKKQGEQLHAELQQEREQLKKAMETYQSQLAETDVQKPDISLAETDPIKWSIENAKYQDAQDKKRALAEQSQKLQADQQRQNEQAMKLYLQQQADELTKHIPEFQKQETATPLRGKLVTAGHNYGFTEQEIAQIVDSRAIRVLNDARKWQEYQKSSGKIEEKVSKARPLTVKPGAKQVRTSGKQKAINDATARMKKTGSIADATNWLLTTS